jgi:hypothetical protein
MLPTPASVAVFADAAAIAPMSWAEICVAYPDQWVGLVDVDKGSDAPYDVRGARVVSHGASPWEVLRALRPFREHHASVRHLFTGVIRSR